MSRKKIHVVFGPIAFEVLIRNQVVSPLHTEIIVLDGSLNIGPIYGLESTNQELQERASWLTSIKGFGSPSVKDELEEMYTHRNSLSRIIQYIKDEHEIYIWCGQLVTEFAAMAQLIHYIPEYKANIYKADFPNIPMRIATGKMVCPKSLVLTSSSEISKVLSHFHLLTQDDFSEWKLKGEKLMTETGTLRILTIENSLREISDDYFDGFLKSQCKTEFQKSAYIVGMVLWEIDFAVGDTFLTWRLKEMIKNYQIEYRGELKDLRDFEIRLAQ